MLICDQSNYKIPLLCYNKKKNKKVVSVTTEFVQVQALKKLKFGSYLAL